MPTFAFPIAPIRLTRFLRRGSECSPTFRRYRRNRRFGSMLDARLLSMLRRSTGELLRTL